MVASDSKSGIFGAEQGNASLSPVAVIGMACRLPGGIDSPNLLWEALLRGDDLITEIPPERWDADQYYDPEPGTPGRSVSKWGSFLDDFAGFDADFFGINEREATSIDPQHRLLLETSWEAIEHAGIPPASLAGSSTGVFVGLTHADYQLVTIGSAAMEGPYGFTGNSFSLASGRIAYALGIHGPAITVDTACSSSLSALHLACRSLHAGESDLVLAGGASVTLEPRKSAAGSAQGMLSPTGRCHAFDVAADGFVSGEGCVVVLLKRLTDALAHCDRILAVVRGTAANQDGHTVNLSTPSNKAQVDVYRTALATAGIDANDVGMVEAHGTGTPVGDSIEFPSLAEVYGTADPCALTSIKTNFGHTQSAAGALGLIKAVLALQHGVIPPNLHFTRLPEDLDQIDTKLFVPRDKTPWPISGQRPRRAAVSSYGLSGTNVHVVLEQAPECALETIAHADTAAGSAMSPPLLFPLSATSAEELRRTAGRLANWTQTHTGNVQLSDLAYTLGRRRGHRPVRTVVVASSAQELQDGLRGVSNGDIPYQPAVGHDDRGPVWVFSGQGSQWARMGAELLAREPVFAATIAEAEPLIAKESGFSVTHTMSAAQTVTGIDRIQPTLFVLQLALAATMKSYGVRPGAVIGHSLGEVAASVVAGALSLQDGVRVICRRSKLLSTIAGSGLMASVELPAKRVLSELAAYGVNDVAISVVTSPQSTVVGGATQPIRDLVAAWNQSDIMAREVAVDVASHSPQVNPILDELADLLTEIAPMTPQIPFYSATLYDPREQPLCDARYWIDNLRKMVRFAPAVQAALEDGYRVFAELAPHPLLTHAVEQTARSLETPVAAVAAMRREQQLHVGLRGFLADLHCAGTAVDFAVLYPTGRLVDAPLPTWTHRQLLLGRDGQRSPTNGACTVAAHPLLGPHVRLQEEPERHVWQAEVGTDALPWLSHHRIRNVPVLPAAAYCEMALTAARVVLDGPHEVREICFEQALLLDKQTTVGASASLSSPGVAAFTVEINHGGEQTRHATASLHTVADEPPHCYDMTALIAAHPDRHDSAEVRKLLGSHGVQYGEAFGGLGAIHVGQGQNGAVLAEIALPGQIRSQQGAYGVHPALLDACFQSVAAHPAVATANREMLALPLHIRRLRAYGSARNARYCYSRVTSVDTNEIEADIDVLDEHGTTLLLVQGLCFGTGIARTAQQEHLLAQRLLSIQWDQRPLPAQSHAKPGVWLLIDTATLDITAATTLTQALNRHGAQCTSLRWTRHADSTSKMGQLANHLRTNQFTDMVILTEPKDSNATDRSPHVARDYVRHMVRIVSELANVPVESPRMYVVTRNAQTVVAGDIANLEQAGLRGLIRVIGAEHPYLGATQIDMDEATDIEQLALQLLSRSDEDETAWRNDQWYTARLRPAPLSPEDRQTAVVDHARDGIRLQIRTPGDLESIELVACEPIPPGPGEIQVAVSTASVNFRDVLIAYGRYQSIRDCPDLLGVDFAGVVTAVGPKVVAFQVGDRVGGMSTNSCWATFVTCKASHAVALPPNLTDEQAAALTTTHSTAWYGLHELARISDRHKVLIHSGTGGVGQAAIAIARAAGAEIFATAGSAQRRDQLYDMGIAHVYDSRTTEFAELIRRDTGGYGVDIVLNSLSGAAQRAGLELLALGGQFVELGKRDIYGDTRLGLLPFQRNLSFHGFDLSLAAENHPEKFQDVVSTVYRLTAEGALPAPKITHYPLADAATAIRALAAAKHTGKLVLDIPRTGRSRVVVPPEQTRVFRRDAAYVITGGLGGLGLFLAEKMAAAGCGRIVLLSRSQPTPKSLRTIDRIRAVGADVAVECGDIAELGTARRLVTTATATGLPLRGVLHLAAVIEDATLTNITDHLIQSDWAPKVYGAWNLHTATLDQTLDWFCSFSSAAALVGSPGQGAYAAANSWLDAFTLWRRAQGLPATAIAWGAWAQIGRAKELAETAGVAIAPNEGAYAFETLLRHDRAYSGYAPIMGAAWLLAFVQHSPFAEAFHSGRQGSAGTNKLLTELDELPCDEWPTRLRRLVSEQVSLILRRSVDPDRPLSEYGLDSLSALELRTRLEDETGVRVNPGDLATIGTIRGLAELLCEKLSPAKPRDIDVSA